MVEKPDRYRVGDAPRDAVAREWDVFVRQTGDESMQHVGSVAAPEADVAYERATRLFAWYANDVWVVPADAVNRYAAHTLDEDADPVAVGTGDEERVYED